MSNRERTRLGELLVAAGVVTEAQLERALQEQSVLGGRLGQALVALGLLDEETLTGALAGQLRLPVVDLGALDVAAMAPSRLPVGVAERYGLVPVAALEAPPRLRLACFDPTNLGALEAARHASGLPCELVLAPPAAIQRTIRRLYYGEAAPVATPGGPSFNVTRNTIDPVAAREAAPGVEARLAALEARLAALEARLEAAPPRGRDAGGVP